MKKILLAVFAGILMLTLVACDSAKKTEEPVAVVTIEDSVTLQNVVDAFEATGKEMTVGSKPDTAATLGTKNDAMYTYDGAILALYEFESEEDYQNALKIFPALAEYPRNGYVFMETNPTVTEEMKEIFSAVKK